MEKVVLERERGGQDAISWPLPGVLYCLEGELEQIITKIRLSIKIVFLPRTNPLILLERYCGVLTEPGLPVA